MRVTMDQLIRWHNGSALDSTRLAPAPVTRTFAMAMLIKPMATATTADPDDDDDFGDTGGGDHGDFDFGDPIARVGLATTAKRRRHARDAAPAAHQLLGIAIAVAMLFIVGVLVGVVSQVCLPPQ